MLRMSARVFRMSNLLLMCLLPAASQRTNVRAQYTCRVLVVSGSIILLYLIFSFVRLPLLNNGLTSFAETLHLLGMR